MKSPVDPKRKFLLREFALLSINAALATRNNTRPVYSVSAGHKTRADAKRLIYRTLSETASIYTAAPATEAAHFAYIEQTSNRLSGELGDALFESRFRIGISQKLINLYLKYLWSSGYCQEPPHCPIDGIIRDHAKIGYDWTGSDSMEDYRQAIGALRQVAGERSLSEWELAEFGRRQSEL